VDARTDIWSLGAILYELIGGRPAFGGNTVANITAQVLEADPVPLTSLRPDTPPELDGVVRKALAKRPEQRWVDVAAFALALSSFAGEVGRAHAERSTRILRGEGRGAGAAAFTAPGMTVDMEATAPGLQDGVDTVRRYSVGRQQRRDRLLLGVLLGLAMAAVFIAWSVFTAYREHEAAGPAGLTAVNGVAGAARPAVASVASRAKPEPPASAASSAPPATSKPSRSPVKKSAASGAPTRAPDKPPEDDPLSTRR
jgi:serine/threonine-protein kinase